MGETYISFAEKKTEQTESLPYGLCVWSTGIKTIPFIETIQSKIAEQRHQRGLQVDGWLRINGKSGKNIFALGDCASVTLPRLSDLYEEFLIGNTMISTKDVKSIAMNLTEAYPQLEIHLRIFERLFNRFAFGGRLERMATRKLIEEVDNQLNALPATAQVAHQQGRYLANLLNNQAIVSLSPVSKRSTLSAVIPDYPKNQPERPFVYKHAGMAAYIGNSHSVIDFGRTWVTDRFLTFWLWRSVYLSEQVSFRTRFMVAFDWIKTICFGRDTSNP